jgi:hypothetical protein
MLFELYEGIREIVCYFVNTIAGRRALAQNNLKEDAMRTYNKGGERKLAYTLLEQGFTDVAICYNTKSNVLVCCKPIDHLLPDVEGEFKGWWGGRSGQDPSSFICGKDYPDHYWWVL